MVFGKSVVVGFLGISLLASVASAQSPAVAKRALLFSTVAQGADIASTLAHPQWSQYEANPLVPRNATGLILSKAGVAIVNGIISKRVVDKHPRLIFWMQMTLGSTLSYVAYHNVRSGARMR